MKKKSSFKQDFQHIVYQKKKKFSGNCTRIDVFIYFIYMLKWYCLIISFKKTKFDTSTVIDSRQKTKFDTSTIIDSRLVKSGSRFNRVFHRKTFEECFLRGGFKSFRMGHRKSSDWIVSFIRSHQRIVLKFKHNRSLSKTTLK